jgi:hypothetical protein
MKKLNPPKMIPRVVARPAQRPLPRPVRWDHGIVARYIYELARGTA